MDRRTLTRGRRARRNTGIAEEASARLRDSPPSHRTHFADSAAPPRAINIPFPTFLAFPSVRPFEVTSAAAADDLPSAVGATTTEGSLKSASLFPLSFPGAKNAARLECQTDRLV